MAYINITLAIGNKSITISKTSKYRLIKILGIEAAEYSLAVSNNAQLDGGYIDNERFMPRVMTLEFGIPNKDITETERQSLIAFLNPTSRCVLTVERNGVTRKISAKINGKPEFTQSNIQTDRLSVSVPLLAVDPFFYDVSPVEVTFKAVTPLLSFPLTAMEGVGITAGIIMVTDEFTVTNNGDLPVGVICDLSAIGGAVTNPKITCNGEYVRMIHVLSDGDKAQIDTRRGHKNIYVNDSPAFVFDLNSIFFQLPVGDNTISIAADVNPAYLSTSVLITFKYLGV